MTPQVEKLLAPLQAALLPMGAGLFERQDSAAGSDVSLLEEGGVPSFEPLLDNHSYFNYHHTPADTLDKVDQESLRHHVALLTSLSWYLANMDQPLGRTPTHAQ